MLISTATTVIFSIISGPCINADRLDKYCSIQYMQGNNVFYHNPVSNIYDLPSSPSNKLFDLITNFPQWIGVDVQGTAGQEIMRQLKEINKYNLDDIRTVYKRISVIRSHHGKYSDNLYLINRYLFAVPDWGPSILSKHFIGGFGYFGRPIRKGKILLIYPFTRNSHNYLELKYKIVGAMGPDMDALDEFDFFRKQFGRRKTLPNGNALGADYAVKMR